MGKKDASPWILSMYPAHLALAEGPNERPYILLRDQLMKTVLLMESHRVLIVQKPRKLTFRLSAADLATLVDWIGKPFLGGFYLRRHYSILTPWAILALLGALVPLLPRAEGAPVVEVNPGSVLMGVLMVLACAMARWRPHAILFLVEAAWLLWTGVFLSLSIWNGRHKAWLILVLLIGGMAYKSIRHFFRFRTTPLIKTCSKPAGATR